MSNKKTNKIVFFMGRPRKGNELRVYLGVRVDPKIAQNIKEIAESLYGNISGITEELILLGLEEYKKKNPDLIKIVEKRQEEKLKSFHDEARSQKDIKKKSA